MMNHSRTSPNAILQLVEIERTPHIYFKALTDIEAGEEVLYDYGERRSKIIAEHPWLLE